MNNKIKVIELLNKIANDESYRPTVKYQEMTYTYQWDTGDYTNDFNSEYGIFSGWALNLMLNNEVEILEDNTEEQEKLGESWKEVGKRVGEWAKEFEQGFKESFTEIINYPFKNLEDNTEEIEELDLTKKQNIWDKLSMCEDKINELIKAVNQIRKDLNR